MTTASLCVSFINGVFIVLLLRCYCKLVLLKCCSRNITNTRSISRSRIKNSNSSTMRRGGEERRKGGEEERRRGGEDEKYRRKTE